MSNIKSFKIIKFIAINKEKERMNDHAYIYTHGFLLFYLKEIESMVKTKMRASMCVHTHIYTRLYVCVYSFINI